MFTMSNKFKCNTRTEKVSYIRELRRYRTYEKGEGIVGLKRRTKEDLGGGGGPRRRRRRRRTEKEEDEEEDE